MSSSKRHFTAVIGKKEQGSYVSSSPSSAARKAVSKLCAEDKKRKVVFSIRETTQKSTKKVYGPYIGYMQKLDKPVELKGRVIRYKPVAKLDKKSSKMKGGKIIGRGEEGVILQPNMNNSSKPEFVSKLIKINDIKLEKLINFESKLNEIDPIGKYHIPMIIERSRRITSESINSSNLDEQEKQQLKSFNPNYKITYEFGGISIEKFMVEHKSYFCLFNDDIFFKNFLLGLVNVIEGVFIFYQNNLHHIDLHAGNIIFSLYNPIIMRLIDWGYLSTIYDIYSNKELSNKIKTNIQSIFYIIDTFIIIRDISEKIINIFKIISEIPEIKNFSKSDFQENAFVIIKEKMLKKIEEIFPN